MSPQQTPVSNSGGPIRTNLEPAAGEPLHVPYLPTPLPVVEKMLDLARVRPSDVVYDLGSGDGRTVLMAAQKYGARAVGVELNDERFQASAARVAALGLGTHASIIHGSLFDTDLREATVVTLYLLTRVNEQLRPKLERELMPGTRVVAHDFPVPGWSPERIVSAGVASGSGHTLFLYRIGEQKEGHMASTVDNRTYTAGRIALELDGMTAGWLYSAEGGYASSDVVTEKVGADGIRHKHLAGVKYDDITISCGTGMSRALYAWLTATIDQKYQRRNGAIVYADYAGKARSRLEFYNALVTEIGFPACDAGSKDPASMTVKISPEYTRMQQGGGKTDYVESKVQKKWLSSNFRLQIDGVDCSRVGKIEALPVRVELSYGAVGELRGYQQEPAYLDLPNLVLTVAESHAQDFIDWFEDFVIKGNSGADNEKKGTLEFLAPDYKEVLLSLTFQHLGIFRLYPEKTEAGQDGISRLRVEMYVEEMEFSPQAAAVAEVSQAFKSAPAYYGVTSASPAYAASQQLTAARLAQSQEFKTLRAAVLDDLLSQIQVANRPPAPAGEALRQAPPLRFRS